jgi:hypothetical protein
MQLRMRMRIVGHFEERQEDIVNNLLEIRHELVQLENITARNASDENRREDFALMCDLCVIK